MWLGEVGFATHFEKDKSYLEKGGKRIWIHVVGRGFYLKALRKDIEIYPVEMDAPRWGFQSP